MSDKVTYQVIGLAMWVHRELGPGLHESFYHDLLSAHLSAKGIRHESHAKGKLVHRGIVADQFEADVLLPERLICELKCLHGGFEPEHYVQLICYLKFWRTGAGLLFDFGKESLSYRRVNVPAPLPVHFEAADLARPVPFLKNSTPMVSVCEAIARILGE